MTLKICLHGPESTGKSTLAPRLADAIGGLLIEEYGRAYAEANGTDFTMADLVTIARTHDAITRDAIAGGADRILLDTDPLMTEVWADMLFDRHDPWFDAWSDEADLYLLFDIDLPWVDDGTRMFGSARRRQLFFDLSFAVLERRALRWAVVEGDGEARFQSAMSAIEKMFPGLAVR